MDFRDIPLFVMRIGRIGKFLPLMEDLSVPYPAWGRNFLFSERRLTRKEA